MSPPLSPQQIIAVHNRNAQQAARAAQAWQQQQAAGGGYFGTFGADAATGTVSFWWKIAEFFGFYPKKLPAPAPSLDTTYDTARPDDRIASAYQAAPPAYYPQASYPQQQLPASYAAPYDPSGAAPAATATAPAAGPAPVTQSFTMAARAPAPPAPVQMNVGRPRRSAMQMAGYGAPAPLMAPPPPPPPTPAWSPANVAAGLNSLLQPTAPSVPSVNVNVPAVPSPTFKMSF